MDQKQLELWADTRAKGRLRYIALNGVIVTGGLYALMMTLAGFFIEYGFEFSQFTTYILDSRTHMRFFFFATAFGAIMGIIKWHRGEAAYFKAMAKESAEPV